MRHATFIQTLLAKQTLPIENHLQEAIRIGQIQQRYIPFEERGKESPEKLATRIRKHAARYQFVPVIFNCENHYVAFGIAGPIITKFGRFMLVPAQVVGGRWGIHYFIFSPDFNAVIRHKELFIRLDSGCISGQIFGDITCDCREQFEIALQKCAEKVAGIVVHIPGHDGRGWTQFKPANQFLMDKCEVDTVRAARLFYGDERDIDQRTYIEAIIILRALGFNERHMFNMATNNPRKIGAFIALGMNVKNTQSIVAKNLNPLLMRNLRAKSKEWKHNFGDSLLSHRD